MRRDVILDISGGAFSFAPIRAFARRSPLCAAWFAITLPLAGGIQAAEPAPANVASSVQRALADVRVFNNPADVEAPAKALAKQFGRAAVDPLVDAILADGAEYRGSDRQLACCALVEIADPDDLHGLKSAEAGFENTWVAAVALPRDAAARETLLRIATSRAPDSFAPAGADSAADFLRAYPPAEVRPRVISALGRSGARQGVTLRALLSSCDYAATLSPDDQKRYGDFQWQLWMAWAIAPVRNHKASLWYEVAARQIYSKWRDGDERFILRAFEDTWRSPTETEVLKYVAAHVRSASLERGLRRVAESDSAKAAEARHALKMMKDRATAATRSATAP